MSTILEGRNITKRYGAKEASFAAVDGVSLKLYAGESVGVVGESGCGKSTLGRLLAGLEAPNSGEVRIEGRTIKTRDGRRFRAERRTIQYVFQHPQAAANPRLTLGFQIAEVLLAHRIVPCRKAARQRAVELFANVGLDAAFLDRYSHQLSGGQRQRAMLARSLALSPKVMVLDEPTSALDLSVQAQVIELIDRLRRAGGLTLLLISHDLGVVRLLSQRIAVMYLGRIVEIGPADAVAFDPRHPYAKALIAARPTLDPDKALPSAPIGEPLRSVRGGCSFAPRCPRAAGLCAERAPTLTAIESERYVACHAAEAEANGLRWPMASAA